MIHEAETQEYFTPLLEPWVHYIPTNLMFSDLVENIRWAVKNDRAVQGIVRNQLEFAHQYISEAAMELYWDIAMEQFAMRQESARQNGQ